MRIFKRDECLVAIDENENYLVKYDDNFYKMNKEQYEDCFGQGELIFYKEIKDSPFACLFMIAIIILTIVHYLANERYVIVDNNIVWANLILLANIFIHEIGHVLMLKLFMPESTVKIGFKFIFIYPAFYVDTSNTYFLPKYKRIAVYLAGNFMNCLYLLICSWLIGDITEYNYLIVSTILINFLPIVKSDGYYAFMSWINKYNYNKTKAKNYIEDTIRGLVMFIVLYFLSYVNIHL